MHATYFDRLPVELFYNIFSYISCHQIIQSFYSINKYINNIILNYDCYFLDFSSSNIRKNEFDLICSIISPKQIIGLKIGKNQFNLINQYLININSNEQSFSHLRSLWLDETISLNEIYSKWMNSIIDYNKLISFRFDNIDKRLFIKQSNSSFKNLSRLNGCSSRLFRILSKEIPRRLTCLHMVFNSIDDLYCFIHPNAQQLKSLGIDIKCQQDTIDQFSSVLNKYQWKQLIQFKLTLQDINNVPWVAIKHILSSMFRLKYLTLFFSKQKSTNSHLFDGNQWKLFLSTSLVNLKRFSLKLPIEDQSEYRIKNCLNTFQSLWWLNEKQWFIEYDLEQNALITVPDFSSKTFDNCNLHSFDMMINHEIFYLNIEELKLNLIESKYIDEFLISNDEDRPCFCHVTRLSLNGHLTKDICKKIRNNIDIRIIKHFEILSTTDDFHEYAQLIFDMPNLSSLHIQCLHTLRLFHHISSSSLFSIRRLVLFGHELTTMKRIYFDLCSLFPYLTYLKTEYHSRRILCYLLDNLVYLDQISFRLNQHDHVPNHAWIVEHSRLTNDSFESEISSANYRERIFVIWINQDKNIEQSSRHKSHKCPVQ